MFLRNAGIHLQVHKTSQPIRPTLIHSTSREPKMQFLFENLKEKRLGRPRRILEVSIKTDLE
jgi:hypothetical protein